MTSSQLERIRRDKCKVGALWHIYHPNDIDKIRHFIHKVLNESGQTLPSGHDPIHDQAMYLDKNMRKRLFQVRYKTVETSGLLGDIFNRNLKRNQSDYFLPPVETLITT
jgi:hypothetical protein